MDLSLVEIVLVRPSRAGQRRRGLPGDEEHGAADAVARRAAARASTSPRRGPSPTAPGTSWTGRGAAASLLEAVAASVAVVGTTGREVPGAWSPRRLAAEADARAGGGTLSLVFGPEASGLTRAELDLCHALVHVPTDPAQPSLNLAQAVLLLAYELRLAALDRTGAAASGTRRAGPRPATWSRR